jgi:flavin-dependent dehydrogenase
MKTPLPIRIVGGGLAGLTLGIVLRRQEVPVTIEEAGSYPRHRVCGEFICGHGVELLRRLHLYDVCAAEGASEARHVALYDGAEAFRRGELPQPALCLSRFKLDALLAGEFQKLGGDLRVRHRVPKWENQPGVVRATGRRLVALPEGAGPQRWIGLKAHARNATPRADLEMHFLPHGYVGLCRLSEGLVNVCGLFLVEEPVHPRLDLARHGPELLRGPANSALHQHLQFAEFDPSSVCAVAGFQPGELAMEPDTCSVGDAVGMIAPVAGNGMSMAFESAVYAAEALLPYCLGATSWPEATRRMNACFREAFGQRLTLSARLHPLLFNPRGRRWILSVVSRSNWLWRRFFTVIQGRPLPAHLARTAAPHFRRNMGGGEPAGNRSGALAQWSARSRRALRPAGRSLR